MSALSRRLAVLCVLVANLIQVPRVFAEAWSFGIIPDTQWSPSDARASKRVPTEIIADVNKQFIQAHVRFVLAVGDICQNAKTGAFDELDIRAAANKDLADAGIRFFPVRGNHDGTTPAAADRFAIDFPGLPGSGSFDSSNGYTDDGSPSLPGLAGKSYAFSYQNATFVLVDTFVVNDGSAKGIAQPVDAQLPWVTSKLAAAKSAARHAFVLSHKNLLGQHHKDNIFGTPVTPEDPGDADPAKRTIQSAFFKALGDNDVRLYFSGHDHIYHRSLVRCFDTAVSAEVQQVITGSCSYKFYEPSTPYSSNETPLVQQRNAVGFVIVTIDGPKVQVNYYSASLATRPGQDRTVIDQWKSPDHWDLTDSFGYSENGKQFVIGKGQSLSCVSDEIEVAAGFVGTKMSVLSGTVDAPATTLDDKAEDRRVLSAQVSTGWSSRPFQAAKSDALTIWGLRQNLNSPRTFTYVLSMKTPAVKGPASDLLICSPNAAGKWVPAVCRNTDGKGSQLINGPWKPECGLGSQGYDPQSGTFWAVLDHEGDFTIAVPQP